MISAVSTRKNTNINKDLPGWMNLFVVVAHTALIRKVYNDIKA